MKIVALMKEVPDPDAPLTLDEDGRVLTEGLPEVPSTYDENAVEAAVTLKETLGGTVTILSLGEPAAEKVVAHALTMGGDDGILIERPSWAASGYDVAEILAAAVRKLDGFDLILCGREAADTSAGLVGPTMAESLGCPAISLVTSIVAQDGSLLVERLAEDGQDQFECRPPLVLTVGGQVNRPRYPSVMAMMQVRRRGVQRWQVDDLAIDREALDRRRADVTVLRQYLPPLDSECRFLPGDTAEEQARALVTALQTERVI